jgi:Trk-type K+ transport system membrane component
MPALIYRFFVGGIIVSAFACAGDVLKPKSFAGLFSAAPSVAIATLSLTIVSDGKSYAAVESRSMIVGSLAFLCYVWLCAWLMKKQNIHSTVATISAMFIWFVLAFGAWFLFLR